MTRINASINPSDLCNQHLLAEYHELPRVLTLAEKHIGKPLNAPKEFTLGTGHVRFFYNKLMFLHIRFTHIAKELRHRGINIDEAKYKEVIERFRHSPSSWYNNWIPTKEAHQLLRARIMVRLEEMGDLRTWQKILMTGSIYFKADPAGHVEYQGTLS